jgi:hypothetical protein
MCPIVEPIGKPGICPERMDVGWNTGYKGYTSPFYENPKDWPRPWGTGNTLISIIENN